MARDMPRAVVSTAGTKRCGWVRAGMTIETAATTSPFAARAGAATDSDTTSICRSLIA